MKEISHETQQRLILALKHAKEACLSNPIPSVGQFDNIQDQLKYLNPTKYSKK